jgi:serine/threonine-protein kinase RsbW
MNQLSPSVLETVTGTTTLDEIQRCLDEFWSAHSGVPEGIRTQVATAVAEVGANIIEHAAKGRPVPIRMELRLLPGEVQVDFTDQGHPADVDLDTCAMPIEIAERGRGLALMRAVLGRVSYVRGDTGNHWTLVSKRFG